MQDEPELKEKDPVSAIRATLKIALDKLKKLGGQEEEELQEELEEVNVTPSASATSDKTSKTGGIIKSDKPDKAKISQDD